MYFKYQVRCYHFSFVKIIVSPPQKVRSLKIPKFWLPLPFVRPCSFSSTPPPFRLPQGMFPLARTHYLPLNFYTCEIWRKEITNEY